MFGYLSHFACLCECCLMFGLMLVGLYFVCLAVCFDGLLIWFTCLVVCLLVRFVWRLLWVVLHSVCLRWDDVW